ncbi:MAG: dockerin type I repeat-containing protein [bacterium]|nr:dockerin type I repeat-containing protein [bacterium]
MKLRSILYSILFIIGLSLTASQVGLVNAVSDSTSPITGPITSPVTPTPTPPITAPITAPIPSPTPTGLKSPCGSYGDVNGDTIITQADALLISNYLVGNITLTNQQKLLADVNASNSVTISDAMFIAQYVAGTRTTFPVCSLH